MLKPHSRRLLWLKILLGLVVLAGLVAAVAWYFLFRQEEQHFSSQTEQFLYGSIGTEEEEGLPYWIWMVLPRAFPQHLPGAGGYTSLGFVWEEGRETPVGISKRTIGFPRVGINCSLCHSGSYRTSHQATTVVVPGAPATRIDVLGYQRFLFACAEDPGFTADNLLQKIEYMTKLSPAESLLYRHVLIPQTRQALLRNKERFEWTTGRPDWGRGRIDPFNPVKFHQLKMKSSEDPSVGNSDMQPLWNRATRQGHHLHWDGLNDSLREVVLSGAIGDGATYSSLPYTRLQALEDWLQHLPAPKYPFAIDAKLATEGEGIYRRLCADCHAPGGTRTGKVIPIAEVGTDNNRLKMWSQEAADIYNRFPPGASWKFQRFQKNDGFLAVPLDGLWLRGPYLHNGSVPTVEALLEDKKSRPGKFHRGYDVISTTALGFVYEGPEAEKNGWAYDTTVQGNGNQGHEGAMFGTTLKADEKKALVEFLKTQ